MIPEGGVAQLGERLLCKQEVIGSIPFTSTIGTSTIGTSTTAAAKLRAWCATFGEALRDTAGKNLAGC